MTRWYDVARRHPCGVLLVVQLAAIVVYPFLDGSTLGRSLVSAIALVVLGLAVWAVRATPALNWVAGLLGVPVVVFSVLEVVREGDQTVLLWSAIVHAAFYFYTAYGLIRYMFSDDVVTTDELYATGATFTVVAWGFAHVFVAAQVIWPGSFIAAVAPADPRTWMDLLFLSVTTLTSTGLSDIVPVKPHARSLVMLEQIAGMLYLAMVVARITALTVNRSARQT